MTVQLTMEEYQAIQAEIKDLNGQTETMRKRELFTRWVDGVGEISFGLSQNLEDFETSDKILVLDAIIETLSEWAITYGRESQALGL